MKKLLILILIFTGAAAQGARPAYRLTSPDGRLTTTVALGDALTYDIEYDGQTLMQPSAIGLKLSDGRVWGPHSESRSHEFRRRAFLAFLPLLDGSRPL